MSRELAWPLESLGFIPRTSQTRCGDACDPPVPLSGKVGGSDVQGHRWLHSEFTPTLDA